MILMPIPNFSELGHDDKKLKRGTRRQTDRLLISSSNKKLLTTWLRQRRDRMICPYTRVSL
jgi:hypothetical protein